MDAALVERIVFWTFSAMAVAGAIGVVMNRNPIPAAMCLVTTFLAVAALYLNLNAGFLTAVQILVYAGAIMVLFLFVIMLLNLEHDPMDIPGVGRAVGGAIGAAFIFAACAAITRFGGVEGESLTDGSAQAVGKVFFADYVFPFEMASILLLIAMIGAVVIGRRKQGDIT